MTETNVLLLDAAKHIRGLAGRAANDRAGDALCCWDTERIDGQDRVIQVRQYPEGADQDIVALPAESGFAEHIAAWDPHVAQAVATLLEKAADPAANVPFSVHDAALVVAKLLTGHCEPGEGL